jgi:ABC-type branched-subunit amino acid transport system ATPase component
LAAAFLLRGPRGAGPRGGGGFWSLRPPQAIVKRFGEITANTGVDFELVGRQIHAIFSENRAGKITLKNIAYGPSQPDQGTSDVEGPDPAAQSSRCEKAQYRDGAPVSFSGEPR